MVFSRHGQELRANSINISLFTKTPEIELAGNALVFYRNDTSFANLINASSFIRRILGKDIVVRAYYYYKNKPASKRFKSSDIARELGFKRGVKRIELRNGGAAIYLEDWRDDLLPWPKTSMR